MIKRREHRDDMRKANVMSECIFRDELNIVYSIYNYFKIVKIIYITGVRE